MAKLNPPILEGKLPAQDRLDEWNIPFTHNPTVGLNDYIGMAIKIKDAVSNKVLYEDIDTRGPAELVFNYRFPDEDGFGNRVGSYYKVQLAYVSGSAENPTVGYYSTIGVVKQTVKPTITVSPTSDLTLFDEIVVNYNFIGDPTEKVVNYQLDFYLNNQLWLTSGELLNSGGATSFIYTINKALNIGVASVSGTLKITITTTNGLKYTDETGIDIDMAGIQQAYSSCRLINNFDIGGVDIYALPIQDQNTYLISKKNKDNTCIKLCTYRSDVPKDTLIYRDLIVEQGEACEYLVQQLDENNMPQPLMDLYTVNFVDFEDMFLFDGEKQLKIRFDPKVSSFKTTILETKTDTIGGHYPVFFRNGNTAYKEFSISGLISYELDNEEMFISKEELGLTANNAERTSTVSNDINFVNMTSGQRIAAERRFKLAVLDWLNNGKPKLFRSPTEGNYYVRLMNVSLSPNDTLGRMIHTFNCTAYEVGEQTSFYSIEGV